MCVPMSRSIDYWLPVDLLLCRAAWLGLEIWRGAKWPPFLLPSSWNGQLFTDSRHVTWSPFLPSKKERERGIEPRIIIIITWCWWWRDAGASSSYLNMQMTAGANGIHPHPSIQPATTHHHHTVWGVLISSDGHHTGTHKGLSRAGPKILSIPWEGWRKRPRKGEHTWSDWVLKGRDQGRERKRK